MMILPSISGRETDGEPATTGGSGLLAGSAPEPVRRLLARSGEQVKAAGPIANSDAAARNNSTRTIRAPKDEVTWEEKVANREATTRQPVAWGSGR